MGTVNKVIILGRLGKDPEVRVTPNGTNVCTISVATGETFMKDGKKQETTEWHKVVLWGKQAELAGQYLKKGRQIYIEGKLQTKRWDDKTGTTHFSTEIVATSMMFVDTKDSAPTSEAKSDYGPNYGAPMNNDFPMEDDIPF